MSKAETPEADEFEVEEQIVDDAEEVSGVESIEIEEMTGDYMAGESY